MINQVKTKSEFNRLRDLKGANSGKAQPSKLGAKELEHLR
jgi:hypothetical protein